MVFVAQGVVLLTQGMVLVVQGMVSVSQGIVFRQSRQSTHNPSQSPPRATPEPHQSASQMPPPRCFLLDALPPQPPSLKEKRLFPGRRVRSPAEGFVPRPEASGLWPSARGLRPLAFGLGLGCTGHGFCMVLGGTGHCFWMVLGGFELRMALFL